MKASIRRFHSPDIDQLETHSPENATRFCFLLQVMVGPDGGEGEESFEVEVCTPEWISETFPEGAMIGRHRLIVPYYDFELISETLEAAIEKCVGDSWDEVALKVSRIGRWEFEDYSE